MLVSATKPEFQRAAATIHNNECQLKRLSISSTLLTYNGSELILTEGDEILGKPPIGQIFKKALLAIAQAPFVQRARLCT